MHRDVKPANLLVTPDRKVKITDFGIARAPRGSALTGTGQVMGTPQYLSPEQARGEVATPASDVYSLGVVAFECLAGARRSTPSPRSRPRSPTCSDPVPRLPDDVPADLAASCTAALAKVPARPLRRRGRFASALRDPADRGADATVAATAPRPATGPDTGPGAGVLARPTTRRTPARTAAAGLAGTARRSPAW